MVAYGIFAAQTCFGQHTKGNIQVFTKGGQPFQRPIITPCVKKAVHLMRN